MGLGLNQTLNISSCDLMCVWHQLPPFLFSVKVCHHQFKENHLKKKKSNLYDKHINHCILSLSPDVLPVGVNTAAAALSPGPSSTATARAAATAAPPATAVSHLSNKHAGVSVNMNESDRSMGERGETGEMKYRRGVRLRVKQNNGGALFPPSCIIQSWRQRANRRS